MTTVHILSEGSNMEPATLRRIRVVLDREPDRVCESLGQLCGSPSLVAKLLASVADEPVEQFWTVALDAKHNAIGAYLVSQGTLSSSLVHPREVFAPALTMGTVAAIIVAHNHPSGDPEPSQQDIQITTRLIAVGELLGVPLLDHVVLGSTGRYTSLRSRMPWT